MRMAKTYSRAYDFFPNTWALPSEIGELIRYHEQHGEDNIYIFKP